MPPAAARRDRRRAARPRTHQGAGSHLGSTLVLALAVHVLGSAPQARAADCAAPVESPSYCTDLCQYQHGADAISECLTNGCQNVQPAYLDLIATQQGWDAAVCTDYSQSDCPTIFATTDDCHCICIHSDEPPIEPPGTGTSITLFSDRSVLGHGRLLDRIGVYLSRARCLSLTMNQNQVQCLTCCNVSVISPQRTAFGERSR